MYNWHRTVLPRVNKIAQKDKEFLQIIQSRDAIWTPCEQILNKLPAADKELIENYIMHCEDLEYRRAQIAYQVGVRDGEQGKSYVQTGWLL